jgi:two-component system, chemotaxis family, sensor kinase CheA
MSETIAMEDEFLQEMLGDFLDESDELLSQLNEKLLELDEWVSELAEGEGARCDDELMNEMFRAAHSFKGLSAMLGLDQINSLTHWVENVFDAARNDQLTFNRSLVHLVFQSIDKLSVMIDCLKDPSLEAVEIDGVVGQIQQVLDAAGASRKQATQADAEGALVDESPAMELPAAETVEPSLPAKDSAPGEENKPVPEVNYFTDIQDDPEPSAKYIGIFIDETEMSLDELSDLLLSDGTKNRTESLMVQCHKIKGSAAAIGLNQAAKLAHFMEDLLQNLMGTGDALTEAMTEAMLQSIDALRAYAEGLKSGHTKTEQFNQVYCRLVAAQTLASSGTDSQVEVRTNESSSESGKSGPNDSSRTDEMCELPEHQLTLQQQADIRATLPDGMEGIVVRVHFQSDLPLVGMKAELVHNRLSALGDIFYCDPPVEQFDQAEQIQCLTLGFSSSEIDWQDVGDRINVVGVEKIDFDPVAKLLPPASTPASDAREPSSPASDSTTPESQAAEAIGVAKAAPDQSTRPDAAKKNSAAPSRSTPRNNPKKEKAENTEAGKKPAETLRVDIDRLDHLMNMAGQLVINKSRFNKIGEELKGLTSSKVAANALAGAQTSLDRLSEVAENGDGKSTQTLDLESVRIHARRIQVDLEHLSREIKQAAETRILVNDLMEAVHQLDRVTEGIQKTVMDTRMVPIGPLFRRFRRVIRDITHDNGKEINLEIRGESTELDKRMIDELGDPLIHIIRNSADHGVESPEERVAAGKSPRGTVVLDAFHRGNSILVQVTDDGKGLDPDKIRNKAIAKGIISELDVEKMSTHQIYQLIWEAGLSTAEKVTQVSGRGMGMDIVRTKIEEINGSVELDSCVGKGTTITLKLPLTMAIMPSLLAEIEGDVFALPVESVNEIVPANLGDLSTVHGLDTAHIRGRIISVVHLNQIFSWNQPPKKYTQSGEDKSLVIIGSEGRELGLVVDRLLGEEDIVIKSMAENYRNVEGIAGASILGDGTVSLILDVATLLEMSNQYAASAAKEKVFAS